jgi:hypothetical protein
VHALSEARITSTRRLVRAAQGAPLGDLAKKMPLPEPHALMHELDLDLALGDDETRAQRVPDASLPAVTWMIAAASWSRIQRRRSKTSFAKSRG